MTEIVPETASCDAEMANFCAMLATWFDGLSVFIAVTKGEWSHASTGHHLMAQRLRKETLRLRRDAEALSVRLRMRAADQGACS